MSGLPPFDSVSASLPPSGENAGAPLMPLLARHLLARPGGEILDEDRRIAALERVVGEALAVRRPCRRQQRLARAHDDLRIEAVRVGDHQRVLDARRKTGRGDIGDARPERAAHAEDLLVDDVGDLVRDVAQRRALSADRKPGHALLLADVEQLELDAHRAIARIGRVADDEVILLEQPPGRELDVGLARRRFDDVGLGQRAELARARQISAHDLADIGLRRQARRPRSRTAPPRSGSPRRCR